MRKQVPGATMENRSLELYLHRYDHRYDHYGITGEVLNWIKAFLSNRTQEVIVDGARSDKCGVTSGVPPRQCTKELE